MVLKTMFDKKKWTEENKEKIKRQKQEYYQRNKEHNLKLTQERKRVNRMTLIETLGGECVDCGATDDLEFDHKHGEEKLYNVSQIMSSTTKVMAEGMKCELRCKSCHREKTNKELTLAYQLLKELSPEEYQRRMNHLRFSDTTQ